MHARPLPIIAMLLACSSSSPRPGVIIAAEAPVPEVVAAPAVIADEPAAANAVHDADDVAAARVPVCAANPTGAWAYYLVAQFDPGDPWAGAATATGRAVLYQSFDGDGHATLGEAASPATDEVVARDHEDVIGQWARELRKAMFVAAGQGDEPVDDVFALQVSFDDVRKADDDGAYRVALTLRRTVGGAHAWNSTDALIALRGRVATQDGVLVSAELAGDLTADVATDFEGKRRKHIRKPMRFDLKRSCEP